VAELIRRLTLFDLTMIAVGAAVGSGIFLTPSSIAAALPSPVWMLGVWVMGGVVTLCGALSFAELGAMMPRAGGIYVYLSEAYGERIGFLYGWAYFLVVTTGAIAALAVAFASYVGYFVPLGWAGTSLVAISGLALLTVVNVVGVRASAALSDTLTVLKLVGIAGLVAVGFTFGSSHIESFASPPIRAGAMSVGLAPAMVGVLWSYGGWQHATFTAGEAKRPRRDVPLSLILGTLLVGLVYVVTNVAYLFLLSPQEMANAPQVASVAVGHVLGHATGGAMALVIIVSTVGTAGIYTMTAPRMYFAMAERGLFFARVAEIHPRYRTPAFAIVLQSVWAMVLISFWRTFESLIAYVVFTDWIFFGLTGAAVFVLRWKRPRAERPYRVLGYPFTTLLFLGTSAWFVVNTAVQQPRQAAAGVAFLALGLPVHAYWAARRKRLSPRARPEDRGGEYEG
jgi:APA family basic amino acid/polyamine antiporter